MAVDLFQRGGKARDDEAGAKAEGSDRVVEGRWEFFFFDLSLFLTHSPSKEKNKDRRGESAFRNSCCSLAPRGRRTLSRIEMQGAASTLRRGRGPPAAAAAAAPPSSTAAAIDLDSGGLVLLPSPPPCAPLVLVVDAGAGACARDALAQVRGAGEGARETMNCGRSKKKTHDLDLDLDPENQKNSSPSPSRPTSPAAELRPSGFSS